MNIRFTDARITEFYEGGLHFKNTGESISVPDLLADGLLQKTHRLDGQSVPVFEVVPETAPSAPKSAKPPVKAADQGE